MMFTVNLNSPAAQTVTVKYATVDGTAKVGNDYTASNGTLTFAPGQSSKTFSVPILGDTMNEPDEFLRVTLSNAVNATIADIQGIGTILNDDRAPALTINNVSVIEGNSGTKNAIFTVTLSASSGQTVTVNAISGNGSAQSPFDYTSGGSRLTFAAGETVKTFSVPVKGDLLNEPDETFYAVLSSPVNCSIERARGVGTIKNDDAAPSITIDDVRIGEGNVGQRVAAFRLKLSAPSGQVIKVNYATSGGTGTANSDYVSVPSTQIAFTTGNVFAYVRVLINGDVLNEADETFNANLSAPISATIADAQAIGTILNDDRAPSLTINDVQISEGNSGSKNLTFTVNLSTASNQIVTVNYATANGIARSVSDYVAKNGSLTFAAGQTRKTVNVVINGDTQVEGDETLYVILSGAANASIGRARGVGIILNDDAS